MAMKRLEKFKDDIERRTGENVIIKKNWGKRWSALYIEKEYNEKDEQEAEKWINNEIEELKITT